MKRIVLHVEKCTACRNCELACAVEHTKAKELVRAVLDGEKSRSRVSVVQDGKFPMVVQCHHCVNAPCVKVCPTEALTRNAFEDSVQFDPEKCTGCNECVQACPFGAIVAIEEDRLIAKCDLCIERLKEGKEPACVTGCPVMALELKEKAPVTYIINETACTGCTLCAKRCPVDAISGLRKEPHVIDQDLCIKCGICLEVCTFDAVEVHGESNCDKV